tara:strand:- start:1217 stop:2974 length:1758 start_codon:yes stop_codon:yes gene_type:complete
MPDIQFGQLQADLPSYENTGAIQVDNVIPLQVGYKSFPSFHPLSSNALTNNATGLFSSISEDGTTNYAGDQGKLYRMSGLAFSDISKSGGYFSKTTEGSRDFWSFTQFGNNIICSNGTDPIQKINETTDTLFSDLVTFTAKYLGVVRDFVFSGFVTEYEAKKDFDSNAISSNEITITAHGYLTGDTVVYDKNGNTALTNLVDKATYYIIKIGANTIKLATTNLNAVAGTAITLTATGGVETHKLEKSLIHNQRIKWSAINDSSDWVPSGDTQSGYQDIVGSHGSVKAIVGGESYAVIFMERAIYRMDYVGTPLIFQFSKVADNIGAFIPKSVVSFGSDIFFLAQDGFYKLSGGDTLAPIGNGKVDDYFYSDLSSNLDGVSSAIDPNNSVAVWSYRGAGAEGSSDLNNKLLIYNYSVDKWATGSGLDVQFISSGSQEAFDTLEKLDVLGDLDSLPKTLDSYWYSSGVYGLAAFNSDKKFGKFLGGSLSATIDTTEFQGAKDSRSAITNVRPIVDAKTSSSITVTVTPITRSSQVETITIGSPIAIQSSGDCPMRSSSRYHRLRVKTTGNFLTMSGVDVTAKPTGKR